MSIVGAAALTRNSPETYSGLSSRPQDDSSGTSFAAMLAGATQAAHTIRPAPAPHPTTTALSEGDGSDDSDESANTSAVAGTSREETDTSADAASAPTAGTSVDPASTLSTLLASLTPTSAIVVPSAVAPAAQTAAAHDAGASTTQAVRDAVEAKAAQATHSIATWRPTAQEPVASQLVGELGESETPTTAPNAASASPQATAQLSTAMQSAGSTPNVSAMATAANVAAVVSTAQLAPQGKGIATSSLANRDANQTASSRPADPQATSTSHGTLEAAKAVVSAADASGLSSGGDSTPDPRLALQAQRLAADSSTASTADDAGTSEVDAATSTDRVLAALDARDRATPAAVSRITLNLESSTGDAERVQLSMRGPAVIAAIDTTNLGNAQQMAARANELASSLGHQGLEAEQLQVRTIAPGTSQQSSNNSSSDNTPRYERSFTWQHGRQRSQQDRRDGRQQREGSQ